jgi:broad specificity phosphatase PhoE
MALGKRLGKREFRLVLSSPALRARRTAEIAGFGSQVELEDHLVEYNYGLYEGRTTAEIKTERPDWNLWKHGCPGGETTAEVGHRADRVLRRLNDIEGAVLVFGHGHMTRVLAARYLGLDAEAGGLLMLDTATLSIGGLEHGRRAISLWNDRCHLDML